MKNLCLFLTLMLSSLLANSQSYVDFDITLNNPQNGDSIRVTKQFNINATITNNGVDTFRVTDTVHFVLSFDGGAIGFSDGNGGFIPYMVLTNKELVPGQTTQVNFGFTLGDTWTLGASEICTKIISINTMDTVGANDSSCANIIVRSSGVDVANLAKNGIDINVYPNPARDVINFDVNTLKAEAVTVILYDIAGRVVAEQVYQADPSKKLSVSIDRGQLQSGMYFYNVITESGSKRGKIELE